MLKPNGILHGALLLLLAALLGAVYPLIKIAEETIPPFTLGMLRALFATLVLLPVVALPMKRDLKPLRSQWKTFALLGLLLSGFYIAIAQAEEYISASLSALMGCLLPIGTLLITTVVMRWERFSPARFAGALLALCGVALFIGVRKLFSNNSEMLGVGGIAIGFLVYSVYLVFARTRRLDPYVAATGTMVFVSGFMAVAALTLERPFETQASSQSLLAALVIGIFSTGLGYVILYYLIANAGPVYTSTFGYFMPIFAILASHFLLSEPLNASQVAGIAITVMGAWLVNRKPKDAALQACRNS